MGQVVSLVDSSHSRGFALHDLRPSCFKLLPSNQVIYLGSSGQEAKVENVVDEDIHHSERGQNEIMPLVQHGFPVFNPWAKKWKFGENIAGPCVSWNSFDEAHKCKTEYKSLSKSTSSIVSDNTSQPVSSSDSNPIEEKWYTSPEELIGRYWAFSSNIYCLGVLLFEVRKDCWAE
ncbi:unnamed protein product [Ilex paraguariensis]|uniref:Protein kinase domain-containing protein n=1 Tax=Ilex paraguariensis TaxID=185542 RepID=A0ABC8T0R8_9AQUA